MMCKLAFIIYFVLILVLVLVLLGVLEAYTGMNWRNLMMITSVLFFFWFLFFTCVRIIRREKNNDICKIPQHWH